MDAITRETLNKWAQKSNWMRVNEAATPNGRQVTFLTPSGNMVIAVYDLKGNLHSIGQPVPVPQFPQGFPKNTQLSR